MTGAAQTRFIGPVREIDTGVPDTVLLHAPFERSAFDQALYQAHGLAFPERLNRAVDKRRADHLAGRILLTHAFARLGLTPVEVPIGPDRAPVWPARMTGSISHARGICACILSTNPHLRVGIDIEGELSTQSDRAVRKVALRASERALVQDAVDPARLSALVFSAKETLYKALYPEVRRVFGFDSAELTAPPDAASLTLRLTGPLRPSLPQDAMFEVRHAELRGHLLTWLISERPMG